MRFLIPFALLVSGCSQNTSAIGAAKDLIGRRIISPATAQFAPSKEWTIDQLPNGAVRLSSWVDFENAFSALLRHQFTAIVKPQSDGAWELSYLSFDGDKEVFGKYEYTAAEQAELDQQRQLRIAEEEKRLEKVRAIIKADDAKREQEDAKVKAAEAASWKELDELLEPKKK